MSPETMILELQRMWNEHPEYAADGFLDYACTYVDEHDTSSTGCVFDQEGYAYPITDYVLGRLDLAGHV